MNPIFLTTLVSLLPSLISAIGQTVEAAAAHNKPGDEKRKEVIEAACAWYDAADAAFKLPDAVDDIVKNHAIPALVDLVYQGLKQTGEI